MHCITVKKNKNETGRVNHSVDFDCWISCGGNCKGTATKLRMVTNPTTDPLRQSRCKCNVLAESHASCCVVTAVALNEQEIFNSEWGIEAEQ